MAEDRPKRPRKKKAEAAAEEAAAAKGGGKTIIIAAAVAALMLGLGLGVGMFMGGMFSPAEEVAEGETAEGEDGETGEPEETRYNIYINVGKMVVTLDDEGANRPMQIEVDLAAYEKEIVDRVTYDMPAIQGRLRTLYSTQDYNVVRTPEGQEAMRLATIDAVNEVLGTTTKNGVHDAFFTKLLF